MGQQPCISTTGAGPGGGSGTHIYAEIVEVSKLNPVAASVIIKAAVLQQLVQIASDIRGGVHDDLGTAIAHLAGQIKAEALKL